MLVMLGTIEQRHLIDEDRAEGEAPGEAEVPSRHRAIDIEDALEFAVEVLDGQGAPATEARFALLLLAGRNSMNNPSITLVTGATGQQGGAVARLLLAQGHRVRALTRRADSPAANELRGRGAELAVGDFDDHASLERAMSGVDAVYLMATPFGGGIEAEVRQGTMAADVARASGVGHLVYSSVCDADRYPP
jgi:hypothetical protein